MNFGIVNTTSFLAFWLCVTRVTTIFIQLPIIDNSSIPTVVRILSSLVVSYAFFPFVQGPIIQDIQLIGEENIWFLTMAYALSGLAIGLLVRVILQLFISAGSLMTQQIGFTSVSYFDPTFVASIGPIEKIIQYTMVVFLLLSGALMPMLKGIILSFSSMNMTNMSKLFQSTAYYSDFFKSVFMMSLLLATPIIFSNLLINVVLGIIARTVPQMNILMVSFVVNIGIGLLIFLIIGHEFFRVGYKVYVEKLGDWFLFIT